MRLLLRPNICTASEFTSQRERDIFEQSLRFKNPNPGREADYNPYYDGMVSFFLDPTRQNFPTGYLQHVLDHLAKYGIVPNMSVAAKRKMATEHDLQVDPNIFPGITLRDYQLEAVKTAIRRGSGIVTAPPRSGKTLIQAAVAAKLDRKSVIFVQRSGLLSQHAETLGRWGMDVGIVQGTRKDFHKKHCIAMLQTVYSSLQDKDMQHWLESIEVLQADECHHVSSAETYYRTVLRCPASWRLGYSGTPFDQTDIADRKFNIDNWRLVGVFGAPIVNVSLQNLQSMGLMVPVRIMQIKQDTPTSVMEIDGNNWHAVYEAGVVENESRNQKIALVAHELVKQDYLPLVLIKHIAHGDELFSMMQRTGLMPIFAKGGGNVKLCMGNGSQMTKGSVTNAYEAMMQGRGNILIATQIGDEGVDLPHIDALILAVGGKADQVTTQRMFRPLTSTEHKKQALVIDFEDRQHGVLKKHSAARRRIYRTLGFYPRMLDVNSVIQEIRA